MRSFTRMRARVLAGLLGMLLLTGIPTSAQPARVVRIISPEQGEMVAGPDVTFIVEAPGVRLPDEHLHVFVDGAALRYVLGNPVPIGQADFVHFRALKTTIRLPAGPHFVVIVAGDPQHVPFWPLVADSRYFFVR